MWTDHVGVKLGKRHDHFSTKKHSILHCSLHILVGYLSPTYVLILPWSKIWTAKTIPQFDEFCFYFVEFECLLIISNILVKLKVKILG